jgi:hypothetical protein
VGAAKSAGNEITAKGRPWERNKAGHCVAASRPSHPDLMDAFGRANRHLIGSCANFRRAFARAAHQRAGGAGGAGGA